MKKEKEIMKEKLVLKKRSTPKIVTLSNGTTFTGEI